MTTYTFSLGSGSFSLMGQAMNIIAWQPRRLSTGTATSKKPKIAALRIGAQKLARIRKQRGQ